MAGTLRLDYRSFTYRQLFVMHESFMLTSWDHTAAILSHISCVTSVLIRANSKKGTKATPQGFFECHPFRGNNHVRGHRIRAENIRDLKAIFSHA